MAEEKTKKQVKEKKGKKSAEATNLENQEKNAKNQNLDVKTKSKSEPAQVENPKEEKSTTQKPKDEKEFIIPLRRAFRRVPRYKRANKAVKTVKEYVARHMKIYDRDLNKIKLSTEVNEVIWARGIKNPPFKVLVKAVKQGNGNVSVDLVEVPEKLKFKATRIDRRETKAKDFLESKKTTTQRLKESMTAKPKETLEEKAQTEEEKKEEQEKKAAVVETGLEQSKQAAKQAKHQTKISKQPKRQQRQALQK